MSFRHGGGALVGVLIARTIACDNRPVPAPDRQTVPIASAAGTAAGLVSAGGAQRADGGTAAAGLPTWTAEPVILTGDAPEQIYFVDGAIMASVGQRVGRIVDGRIEWLARQIPKEAPALGDNVLDHVVGAWPDAIGALYRSGNGRSPQPAYLSLTGKREGYMVAPVGTGQICGVARVGDSTLVAAHVWYEGLHLVPVGGPRLARKAQSAAQGGCKEGEVYEPEGHEKAAMRPFALEGTPDGSLVSIGSLCDKRGPAAEIWDSTGKSHFVDLSPWLKQPFGAFVRGKGDDLWFSSDVFHPVLHIHGGAVTPLPFFDRPLSVLFTSPAGKLQASDGQTIFRHDEGGWVPVARLAGVEAVERLAYCGETLWAKDKRKLYQVHPGAAPGAAGDAPCASPFVYLYDVSAKNDKAYTYPTTQKALSTFAGVADLGLVEFEARGRRLGVTVTGKAQGEALVAHMKEAMKDETPRFLCYAPPHPRKIALEAGAPAAKSGP